MTLSEWRKREGLSLEAVASKLDKSKGHLHAVETENKATARLALDIEKLTNGEVDAAFLNAEIAEARRQKAA
jgi:transcriptional regulator with XRE-family HTH domain